MCKNHNISWIAEENRSVKKDMLKGIKFHKIVSVLDYLYVIWFISDTFI